MTITVNGTDLQLDDGATVVDLLARLEAAPPCAVEVNREVVPRREHAVRILSGGDVVEVVTLVGGG